MAELINVPQKAKGNKLTAEEFNEVVGKSNSAITEFNNSKTSLSGLTETVTGLTETVTGLTETVTGLTERIEILETGSTALTSITWTTGQPMPEIDADIIVGTISEGETKYVQTGLLGEQTFAILSSPNVELTSTKVDTFQISNINPLILYYNE